MKIFFALVFMTTAVSAAQKATKKSLPIKADDKVVKQELVKKDNLKLLDKKEEDCDAKAKKTVEIKAESISLSGNTGCSLDEAH
jgi:hypothetical protein